MTSLSVAVDIGGTFTDVVLEGPSGRVTTKVLTTPAAPEEGVIEGIGVVLKASGIAPGAIGRDDTLPELPFDATRARALLAEAGYPDGWRWTIIAPNGLFSGDAKIAQAIAQMLTRIGIETKLDTMVNAMFIPKINAREHPMFMMSYLSSTSVPVLRSIWISKGAGPGNGVANRMEYKNPELDRIFLGAVTRMDDAQRARELAQAMRIGIEDLATIPVVFAGYNWVTRRDRVTIEPNVLGFTQALLMRLPAR